MNAWLRVRVATACFALMGLMTPSASLAQSATPDCSKNLVYNGDFSENGGSLDGWNYDQSTANYYWQPISDGTTYYAFNGCYGDPCINGDGTTQNYLSQDLNTIPVLRYKLTFTYDAGAGGINELKVLFGTTVVEDIVNVGAGANTYTVTVRARRFSTILNFLGRQDNAFSFLSNISVTPVL